MKTISVALKAHLAQPYQTLATCWHVTLRNGTEKFFTDHDSNIVFEGDTYLATSGYISTDVGSTDRLDPDTLDVQGMLESPSITESDLKAGLWDFAAVEIFMVNWADLTQGRLYLRYGKLGEVTAKRASFIAELRGLTQAYSRVIGELTSPTCRATLGDNRCRVDLYPLTVSGTIDSVGDDNMTIFDAARTEPGPAGGVPIVDLDPFATRARIDMDMDNGIGLYNGQILTLSGIVGPAILNGLVVATDQVLGFQFFVDMDISAEAAWTPGTGTVTPLGADSGYFDHGVMTWITGNNANLSREVKSYVPGMWTLVLPMPYEIEAGDEYFMTPGCNKIITTCKNKFNNVLNNRSEPFLGGLDKLMQVGRRG